MEEYTSSLTREQFMFPEMRTTARLLRAGLSDAEVVDRICGKNLYQYPTERSLRRNAGFCVARLNGMRAPELLTAVAAGPVAAARQICLYAMMTRHRLLRDFMITVIGARFRMRDLTFSRRDVGAFLTGIREQHPQVARWSDQTLKKSGQVIAKALVEGGLLPHARAAALNAVIIEPALRKALADHGEEILLPVFNCLD